MMGTLPSQRQQSLWSYRELCLERRVPSDHLLRQIDAALDLSFVLPTVAQCYGRSGHRSLDPRLVLKLMLLLFLYDLPSERELMRQLPVRLDFLWFLGLDLDSEIPDHSVLSKARRRWGAQVFEKLFVGGVGQCVDAGLVDGRLLHVDSTMVRAHASRSSVVSSSPELVQALRAAYQQQEAKLEVIPAPAAISSSPQEAAAPPSPSAAAEEEGAQTPAAAAPQEPASHAPVLQVLPPAPLQEESSAQAGQSQDTPPAQPKTTGKKPPVNCTHISTTDPESELARSKNGLTELNYKEHRLVDDAHGIITALETTTANVADGVQLPPLHQQHVRTTGLAPAQVTMAADQHYGTADNYIYSAQQGIRAHLGDYDANVEGRGLLPTSRFVYEAQGDRMRCPQGRYLEFHQHRPEDHEKVYKIKDLSVCAGCKLRPVCTKSKSGRSIRRHDQAELLQAARAEARSEAARYSRRRRQHVMEGSFADAANNHGAKQARWRGLERQRIQSWIIAAVQNLRRLVRHQAGRGPVAVAVIQLRNAAEEVPKALQGGSQAVKRPFWLWDASVAAF